jgi:hypothetical protein
MELDPPEVESPTEGKIRENLIWGINNKGINNKEEGEWQKKLKPK